MLSEDPRLHPKPRPPRGFSDTAPPGFVRLEGRGFPLVAAEYLGRLTHLTQARESLLQRLRARRSSATMPASDDH
jgi:hypothetical protein